MSELGEARKAFTRLIPRLIDKMIADGMQPMIGKDGLKHMKNSLHYEGLAVDIDLCDSEGTYLTGTEDHRPFGEYWESLDSNCSWGGRFKGGDGNHYSWKFGGRK